MALVTLTEVKAQLRITGSSDDTLLSNYMVAAEDIIVKYLNRDIPTNGDSPEDYPMPIKIACTMIIADLYENRQSQLDKQMYHNRAVDNLLYPYRDAIGI